MAELMLANSQWVNRPEEAGVVEPSAPASMPW